MHCSAAGTSRTRASCTAVHFCSMNYASTNKGHSWKHSCFHDSTEWGHVEFTIVNRKWNLEFSSNPNNTLSILANALATLSSRTNKVCQICFKISILCRILLIYAPMFHRKPLRNNVASRWRRRPQPAPGHKSHRV